MAKRKRYKEQETEFNWPIIILVICVFVLLIALSWGKLDVMEEFSSDESFEERRLKAEIRNNKLKLLVGKKHIAKRKLTRKFLWIYFSLATTFILFVGVTQIALFLLHLNIILWDGVFTSSFLVVYTVYFRKKFSLFDLVKYCELKIQNKVFGKYVNIDEQIGKHEQEIKELEPVLSAASVVQVPSLSVRDVPKINNG